MRDIETNLGLARLDVVFGIRFSGNNRCAPLRRPDYLGGEVWLSVPS